MRPDRPLIGAIVALIASVPILVAVSAPAQGAPLGPTLLATTSDVISGTITVALDGGPQVTVSTNATGGWTLISPKLADGQHFAVARAIDPGGTTETGPANFLVDTTPPALAIAAPANGSKTSDPTPPIIGTVDSTISPGVSHLGTIAVTIDGGAPITVKPTVTGD